MIAVIFEFEVDEASRQEYFDFAARLRAELEKIDGFISIERFASLSSADRFVSLSFFRDEEAIRQWRNLPLHRRAQAGGRTRIFRDYRLRVAEVLRDYGMNDRAQAPADSLSVHSGETAAN
jgi:heme-degrading monooxygenase HmoA